MEKPRKVIQYKNGYVVKFKNKRFSVIEEGDRFALQFAKLIDQEALKNVKSILPHNSARWIAREKILIQEITISKNDADYLVGILMLMIDGELLKEFLTTKQ